MKAKVEVNDKELQNIIKKVRGIGAHYVKVGVIDGKSDNRDDKLSPSLIAASNEFGTKKIPERSFMRSTMGEQKNAYNKILKLIANDVLYNKKSLSQLLGKLGLRVERDIKKKITDITEPPNAPSTIRAKQNKRMKSANKKWETPKPLIDTGQMRASIIHVVEKGSIKKK